MVLDVLFRLVGIVLLLLALRWLSDWIATHLQGLGLLLSQSQEVAVFFMFLVLAPGILVHETSHWLVARLLGVRTTRFRVWPRRVGKERIQLGAVEVRGAGPLAMVFIGAAPFLIGTVLLILLGGWWRLPTAGMADWRTWLSAQGWARVRAFFAQGDWPWRLYAIWVIASSMMPSEADREPLRFPLLVMGLAAVAAYFAGLIPEEAPGVYTALVAWLDLMGAAFLLAVIANGLVAAFLAGVEYLISRVVGAEVHYG